MKATVHHVRILRSGRVARAQFTLTLRQGRRIVARGIATLQGDAELSEDSIQIVESPHDLSAELHKLQDAEADEEAGQAFVNAVLDACFARLSRATERDASATVPQWACLADPNRTIPSSRSLRVRTLFGTPPRFG